MQNIGRFLKMEYSAGDDRDAETIGTEYFFTFGENDKNSPSLFVLLCSS
jgi:hypothetical protein